MPYYITDKSSECSSWAVVKEDGEVMACHNTKAEAQAQMVAISLSEGIEPGGERDIRALPGDLKVGDYVSWNSSGGRARGEIQEIVDNGSINPPNSSVTVNGTEKDPAALIQVYQPVRDGWEDTDVYVAHKFSTLTKIAPLPEPSDEPEDEEEDDDMEENSMSEAEYREVNLEPPAYMRAAARRGLKYYEEGYGGDGLVERTIREARAMAAGNVTADKWVRIRAWIARHLPDLDSPAARPDSPDYSDGYSARRLTG